MATEAKRGLDIVIKIGGVVVAGQRGATLNRSANNIDITNKVSGLWKENMAGTKEWSVDCDGLFVMNDTALGALETAFNAGTEVEVTITDATGAFGYYGQANITDFPIEAPYDDVTTYSVSLMGNGALVALDADTAKAQADAIVSSIFGTVNVDDNLLSAVSAALDAGYTASVYMADGVKIAVTTGIALTTGTGIIQFKITKTSDSSTALTQVFELTVNA